MKVLSYLEIQIRDAKSIDESSYTKMYKYLQSIAWDKTMRDFYAQPFKPELIDLFEGWECITDNHLFSEYSSEEYAFNYDYKKNGTMKFYIHDVKVVEFPFPRTLDEFITDCQRAGIELIWRKK